MTLHDLAKLYDIKLLLYTLFMAGMKISIDIKSRHMWELRACLGYHLGIQGHYLVFIL